MGRWHPWVDNGQNVMTEQEFNEDGQRENGFQSGDTVSSAKVNAGLRQANLVASALMNEIDKDEETDLQSSEEEVKEKITDRLGRETIEQFSYNGVYEGKEFYRISGSLDSDFTIAIKVSDKVLTKNDLVGSSYVFTKVQGQERSDVTTIITDDMIVLDDGELLVVREYGYEWRAIVVIPFDYENITKGTYAVHHRETFTANDEDSYVSLIDYKDVKTIDKKYTFGKAADGEVIVSMNGQWTKQTGYGYKSTKSFEWDGDITDKYYFLVDWAGSWDLPYSLYAKVSDDILTRNDLIGSTIVIDVDGVEQAVEITEEYASMIEETEDYIEFTGALFIAKHPFTKDAVEIEQAGTYLGKSFDTDYGTEIIKSLFYDKTKRFDSEYIGFEIVDVNAELDELFIYDFYSSCEAEISEEVSEKLMNSNSILRLHFTGMPFPVYAFPNQTDADERSWFFSTEFVGDSWFTIKGVVYFNDDDYLDISVYTLFDDIDSKVYATADSGSYDPETKTMKYIIFCKKSYFSDNANGLILDIPTNPDAEYELDIDKVRAEIGLGYNRTSREKTFLPKFYNPKCTYEFTLDLEEIDDEERYVLYVKMIPTQQ